MRAGEKIYASSALVHNSQPQTQNKRYTKVGEGVQNEEMDGLVKANKEMAEYLFIQERVEEGGDSTMHEVTGGDEPKADDPQLKRVRCCANPPGDACTSFA
jgi:hypothetical protein